MKNSIISLAYAAVLATTFGGILEAPAFAHPTPRAASTTNVAYAKKLSPYYSSRAFEEQVQVYFNNEDYRGLYEFCTKAIENNNRNADAYYFRAVSTFMMGGETNLVISDLSAAISLEPGFVEALKARAGVYSSMKQPASAVPDLKTVLSMEPQNVDVVIALVSNHYDMGDLKSAIEDCSYWISLSPFEPSAYYVRGLIFIELDNKVAALSDLETAHKLLTAQNRPEEAQKVQVLISTLKSDQGGGAS